MAVTNYFKALWQDFVQFLCQTKNNSIDRMIKVNKWSLNFHDKPNLKILLFCTAQDYNQAISHVILSQIFDNAKNAFSILSDQYTDNSSCFLLW